jgi:hypothetical protein
VVGFKYESSKSISIINMGTLPYGITIPDISPILLGLAYVNRKVKFREYIY